MAASYTVSATGDTVARTVTFVVSGFAGPAATPAVFKVAGPTTNGRPNYLGVCTTAELASLPTEAPADPQSSTPYRLDTAVVPCTADLFAVCQENVFLAVQRLALEIDRQAAGLQMTTAVISATGW